MSPSETIALLAERIEADLTATGSGISVCEQVPTPPDATIEQMICLLRRYLDMLECIQAAALLPTPAERAAAAKACCIDYRDAAASCLEATT